MVRSNVRYFWVVWVWVLHLTTTTTTTTTNPNKRTDLNNDNSVDIELKDITSAANFGLNSMRHLVQEQEMELYKNGLWLRPGEPASQGAAFNAAAASDQRLLEKLQRFGYASVEASKRLVQQWHGRTGDLQDLLEARAKDVWHQTPIGRQCPRLLETLPCRNAAKRYRTADGACNNEIRPRLGAAPGPQQRFLAPRYADGVQAPRSSVFSGADLPSPRLISARIHQVPPPTSVESPSITLMLMQWGQLLDHDITATAQSRAHNGSTPRCCSPGGAGALPQHLTHPECFPIVDPTDGRCMEFVRSAPFPREHCDFGHRQQLNQVTAFIDASALYGSSVRQSDSSRLFQNGLIQLEATHTVPQCQAGAVALDCVSRAGDARASEQPALTSLHIMLARHHNQLSSNLAKINPHWRDERLYQETRKIISAIIQHVTYREFLPVVLGAEVMRLFDLQVMNEGFYKGYDPRVDPAPSAAFSAAAFRFGHSLVPDTFVRSDKFHRPIFNNVSLHLEQSNLANIWSTGSVDRLILGLVNQPAHRRDEYLTPELTQNLFGGLDLAAINIQRGRDHGVAGYTTWREPCGLSSIRDWTELQRVLATRDMSFRLRELYSVVDDIDLYTAGLAERPVRGGLVGPTFACIIAQQFANLRHGDRFWYENAGFESSFTLTQLQQIRKVTLAQIICKTMPEVETIQPFVFLTADDFRNQRRFCKDLFDFDLTPWTDKFSNEIDSNNDIENKSSLNINNSDSVRHQTFNNIQADMSTLESDLTKIRLKRDLDKNNTDLTIQRIERKRKRPNRRKTKPKPTNNTITTTNKTKKLYYSANSDGDLTYLVDTVKKTTTSTTPKPDYQFHIQINYFYNTTTETYSRPTPPTIRRPINTQTYPFQIQRPNFDENKQTLQNFNYDRPNRYQSQYQPYNIFDKIDFGPQNDRYSTRKPSVPITLIEFGAKPEPPHKPNIYIVSNPTPTPVKQNYNPFLRPGFETRPETYIYKRPIHGHITKVDSKPLIVYDQANINPHKHYGTHVIYDSDYLTNFNQRPTQHYQQYQQTSHLNDKLDFSNLNSYMQVTAGKKPMITTPRPHDDDKRYVRISTVKGHTTKSDSLNPIFFSVQNKESEDDLEIAYDDIIEVYMKPHSKSNNENDKSTTMKNNKTETINNRTSTEQIDDSCSTELPRPIKLLFDDELLEI